MLNELKESTNRQRNEIRYMMHGQNENTNKDIKTIKRTKQILGLKDIITELKKFTSRFQQLT